ncbi:MAG: putative Ig domain-containing protein [Planctomycetota bacterium]
MKIRVHAAHVVLTVVALVLLGLFATATASAQPVVLICSGESGAGPQELANALGATGLITTIDGMDISQTTPTVATLSNYDAVIVYTNSQPLDTVTLGNNLATYVNNGGGVVEISATSVNGFHVAGNWTSHTCLQASDNWDVNASTIGTLVEAHPVITNVNTFNAGVLRLLDQTVVNGARILRRYSDNSVLAAVNESFAGRIAAVNVFAWTDTVDPDIGWATAGNDVDLCIAQACVWVANPLPQISTPAAGALPDGYTNVAYSQTVVGSGGATPYTWSISAGSLPTGLSINSTTGQISGNPSATGTFNFTVQLTDNNNDTDTRAYSIVIYGQMLIASPAAGALPDATLNNPYGPVAITSSGGKPTLVWSISAGSLPPGITQNTSTGALSGTPTSTGTFNFTVRVQDANSQFATRAYSITVYDLPVINSPAAGALTPEAYVGTSYNKTFTVVGGVAAFVWSQPIGTLPPGLSINSGSGVLSGTPTASGNYSFSIRVTDGNNDTDTKAYTLQVLDAPTITSPAAGALPPATQNAPNWQQTFSGANGKSPYAWSATGLPAGLTMNASSGLISGTPTAAGNFNINVTLTDSNGKTAVQANSLLVNAAVGISGSSLPNGEEDVAYSATPTRTGGTAPYTWSMIINPSLPELSMDPATGLISGTPPVDSGGNYTVTVTITDSLGGTVNKPLNLLVSLPGGGTAANCGCNSRATDADAAFGGWLALLLPTMLLVTLAFRRRAVV